MRKPDRDEVRSWIFWLTENKLVLLYIFICCINMVISPVLNILCLFMIRMIMALHSFLYLVTRSKFWFVTNPLFPCKAILYHEPVVHCSLLPLVSPAHSASIFPPHMYHNFNSLRNGIRLGFLVPLFLNMSNMADQWYSYHSSVGPMFYHFMSHFYLWRDGLAFNAT